MPARLRFVMIMNKRMQEDFRMQKTSNAEQIEKRAKGRRIWRRIGIWMLLILLFFAMAYGANNRIEVTKYTYETDALSVSFNGFRIVHLTDLHNKVFAEENEALLREVRALEPDIIVLTGDFIDASNHTNVEDALLFMRQIPEVAPTYYVYGNHEHYLSKEVLSSFEEKIKEYGVHFLYNETVQIESQTGQTLSLIGLDDLSLQANILKTLADEAPDDFQILLAHEPQYLRTYYAETGVDLVFSGHAHAGQWRIPFTHQGLYAPDQGFLPEFTDGVYTEGDTTMYLSRGLGNSGFPLRLFNHPEIVCVTLQTVSADPS